MWVAWIAPRVRDGGQIHSYYAFQKEQARLFLAKRRSVLPDTLCLFSSARQLPNYDNGYDISSTSKI